MEPSHAERRNAESPVPENEMEFDTARSSGKGGQNVNKRDTKVVLDWNVGASSAFSDEEKALIREYARNRLNGEDVIVLYCQTERSQLQNKHRVVEMLQELVREALIPEKERKATKPTYGSKQRRMDDKSRTSRRKEGRRAVDRDDW
jgi:ribosome-associated protein